MRYEIHPRICAFAAFLAARASMKETLPRHDESNGRIRTCWHSHLVAVIVQPLLPTSNSRCT